MSLIVSVATVTRIQLYGYTSEQVMATEFNRPVATNQTFTAMIRVVVVHCDVPEIHRVCPSERIQQFRSLIKH